MGPAAKIKARIPSSTGPITCKAVWLPSWALGMCERRRGGSTFVPAHGVANVKGVIQGRQRYLCQIPHRYPVPLYRTSLHSLFCVSVRSVGPFEPDLIALPHASAGGREILDLSLHSPTLGAGGRETLLFSFQICP